MMKPEEFISFEDKKPDENKWIIVTNNLNAQNAYSEMFHVWLVNFFTQGSNNFEGLVALDEVGRKIINLTHWKYV